eukprot:7190037-Heterocapsa_arctica.AAC.1
MENGWHGKEAVWTSVLPPVCSSALLSVELDNYFIAVGGHGGSAAQCFSSQCPRTQSCKRAL